MTGIAAGVLAGGVAAASVLLAAVALRPLAGAMVRGRAHRRGAGVPAATSPAAPGGRPDRRAVDQLDPDSVATASGHHGKASVGNGVATESVRSVERPGDVTVGGGASGVGTSGVGPSIPAGGARARDAERVGGGRSRIPGPAVAFARRRARVEAALHGALVAADLQVAPATALRAVAGGGTVAVLVAAMRWGTAGAVVAAALAVSGPVAVLSWRRGRADRRLAAALPGVLEGVAGRLRAGASLPEALADAADEPSGSALLDADLGDLRRRIAHGQPFADAVEGWAERRPAPGVGLVAAALVLGAEAGGARARAIDGVAATLRDRRAVAAEVDALSTQARASALVMMGAPVVFAALGLLSDPEVARFLLATPAGLACLVLGLGLDALAGWWMVGIARSAR